MGFCATVQVIRFADCANCSSPCFDLFSAISLMLNLTNLTRTFPGVRALDDVSFDLRAGEVHVLVGENGAGKSTLINIVSGVLQPESGQIQLDDEEVSFANPVAARGYGIATVHQEAEFFPPLSVAENMAMQQGLPVNAMGLVDWKAVDQSAREAIEAVGEAIDTRIPASVLSVAHRHMTQIAATVLQQAKVVILDEPTSALTAVEADWLFEQIRRLKQNGAGVIYISHRQEEIFRLADRITVLRDGRRVWTKRCDDVTPDSLIEAMVGRTIDASSSPAVSNSRAAEEPRISVRNLSDVSGTIRDVNFDAWAGEVVGIYGLIGAGRSEFAQTLFGLRQRQAGTICLNGQTVSFRHPQTAVANGIAYLPEDRLRQGLFPGLSVKANVVLSALNQISKAAVIDRSAELANVRDTSEQLAIRLRSVDQPINQLSGGNQQKAVLGRWLLTEPKVLILDEPTRGVDIGAKAEIHRLLRQIAGQDCAVVMISSELPEVMQHSDRIVVMRAGEIAGEFDASSASATEIASVALPVESSNEADDESRRWRSRQLPRGEFGLLAVVILLAISLLASGWGLGQNETATGATSVFSDWLAETALWVMIGMAAAIVIIAGGIDISIGSLLALAAVCAGMVLQLPIAPALSIPLAVFVAAGVGVAGGLINGAVSLVGRVHPIVVTLGMMSVYRGLVIELRLANDLASLPSSFTSLIKSSSSAIHGAILIVALVIVAMYLLFSHTRLGRHFYAIGSSLSASRLVGISHGRVWLLAFGLSGLLVGIAAVLELGLRGNMNAQLGVGWELNAIAIAVVGGVSISGGRGTVAGIVLGAILFRLVETALVHWHVSGRYVELVAGGLILAAVLCDLALRRRDS